MKEDFCRLALASASVNAGAAWNCAVARGRDRQTPLPLLKREDATDCDTPCLFNFSQQI
jgi:hypothetical protein